MAGENTENNFEDIFSIEINEIGLNEAIDKFLDWGIDPNSLLELFSKFNEEDQNLLNKKLIKLGLDDIRKTTNIDVKIHAGYLMVERLQIFADQMKESGYSASMIRDALMVKLGDQQSESTSLRNLIWGEHQIDFKRLAYSTLHDSLIGNFSQDQKIKIIKVKQMIDKLLDQLNTDAIEEKTKNNS